MDKLQTLNEFWNGFGIPAYDESTVPPNAVMPYITYNAASDSIENVLNLNASIWYHSKSWSEITKKSEEIAEYIVNMHPAAIALNKGRLYIAKGTPFAQRMKDSDDSIRRIVLNIQVEFLTAY